MAAQLSPETQAALGTMYFEFLEHYLQEPGGDGDPIFHRASAEGIARTRSLQLLDYTLIREALGHPVRVLFGTRRNGDPAWGMPLSELLAFEIWRRLEIDPTRVPSPLVDEPTPMATSTAVEQAEHFLILGRADGSRLGTFMALSARAKGRHISRRALFEENAWLYDEADAHLELARGWCVHHLPAWALRAYVLGFTEAYVGVYQRVGAKTGGVSRSAAKLLQDLVGSHWGDRGPSRHPLASLYPDLFREGLVEARGMAHDVLMDEDVDLRGAAHIEPVSVEQRADGSLYIPYGPDTRLWMDPGGIVATLDLRSAA